MLVTPFLSTPPLRTLPDRTEIQEKKADDLGQRVDQACEGQAEVTRIVQGLQNSHDATKRDLKSLTGHLPVGDFQILPSKLTALTAQVGTDKATLREEIRQLRETHDQELQNLRNTVSRASSPWSSLLQQHFRVFLCLSLGHTCIHLPSPWESCGELFRYGHHAPSHSTSWTKQNTWCYGLEWYGYAPSHPCQSGTY